MSKTDTGVPASDDQDRFAILIVIEKFPPPEHILYATLVYNTDEYQGTCGFFITKYENMRWKKLV